MMKSALSRVKKRKLIPLSQAVYMILSFGLLISSICLFFVEPELARPFFGRPFNIYRIAIMTLAIIFLLLATKNTWGAIDDNKDSDNTSRWLHWLGIIMPIIALIFLLLQLFNPELDLFLVRNEKWPFYRNAIFIKAICQLVAAGFFIVLVVRYIKRRQPLAIIFSILIVLLLIIMAGEELSWGQRIFGWATPELFADNIQGETNLHNFATQIFQNVLYFGGWLLLIGFSFWHKTLTKLVSKYKHLNFLTDWIPPASFMLIFAASFGFVDPIVSETGIYYGSNLFIVIATFILLLVTTFYSTKQKESSLFNSAMVLVIFTTVLVGCLVNPTLWQLNGGAVTEHLELFISAGILCWAINIANNTKEINTTSD